MKANKTTLYKLHQLVWHYMSLYQDKYYDFKMQCDLEVLRHCETISEFLIEAENRGRLNMFLRIK